MLGDRTQAPSGAGFALENRVATTRALSDIYGEMHVHRLAGFFRRFRDALTGMAGEPAGRVAILTPGPLNETYYEHAYIARYLGIMLLEGEDLTVTEGRLMVRTVSGLKPVSVLWRRLDAAFADPLELRRRFAHRHAGPGRGGAPGLGDGGQCARLRHSGDAGASSLSCRSYCAGAARQGPADLPVDRDMVVRPRGRSAGTCIDNLDRMMIGPALSTRLPFEDDETTVLGASLGDEAARGARSRQIEADGGGFVGQEAVTLSTTPVFVGGLLEPRPASLRVYLARTPDGWTVMPGGFARIGSSLRHDGASPCSAAARRPTSGW